MESIEESVEQEMTILGHRMALEKRIREGVLKLLLCDLEKLPCTFILQLQRDLEEWNGPEAS